MNRYADFIHRFETTGDWGQNPWFLDPDFEDMWGKDWIRLGLPREKRVLANESLKKIFPPDVVMGMKEDPRKWYGNVISLFGGITFPSHIVNLIDLGVDTALTHPWADRAVLRRLQHRQSHYDTAFEIAVHAGLLRSGAIVERVPEAPPEKRHDFNIHFHGFNYEIEVKLTGSPDLDRLARDLHSRLDATVLTVPGLHLVLRGSELLADMSWDDPAAVDAAVPEILEAYSEAAKLIRSIGKPGHYPTGKWGFIEATPGPVHGSVEDQMLPDLPEEKQARRVIRKVRDGLDQFSGLNHGVLVVGLYKSAQPDDVKRLILNDIDIDMARTLAKKCVMIVLCDQYVQWKAGFMAPERFPVFYAFSPLLVRQLHTREMELAVAASSTHWAKSTRMDWQKPGHISTRLSSSRPTQTLWSLGSKQWKPGETMTFSFDGLPNARRGRD